MCVCVCVNFSFSRTDRASTTPRNTSIRGVANPVRSEIYIKLKREQRKQNKTKMIKKTNKKHHSTVYSIYSMQAGRRETQGTHE